jgi:hypothetical protein
MMAIVLYRVEIRQEELNWVNDVVDVKVDGCKFI